jgi:hypothetical protein
MEAIRSSETSVNKISTRRHIPEDGIIYVRIFSNCEFKKLRKLLDKMSCVSNSRAYVDGVVSVMGNV